jgi:hypothetical protein
LLGEGRERDFDSANVANRKLWLCASRGQRGDLFFEKRRADELK